jgi:hypothetical protein
MAELVEVRAPESGLFRIVRQPVDPFAFPDWARAGEDGTFGNRYDDPWLLLGLPTSARFRVIYCATQREAAVGEILARFRPSIHTRLALAAIEDDEPLTTSLAGVVDPRYPTHGIVPYDWIQRRQVGMTLIAPFARFVDLGHASTLAQLHHQLGSIATLQGIQEIDLSAMTSQARRLTQYAARYIHDQGFAGIRYTSRLGQNWECWALFEDRFAHRPGQPGPSELLRPDDGDLLTVAGLFGISVEAAPAMGQVLRPWQNVQPS